MSDINVYMTKYGELHEHPRSGQYTFRGLLGEMPVPRDTMLRATRIGHKFPHVFNRLHYMADWCHFKLLQASQ